MRIRWWIALLLDKNKNTCWVRLALWGMSFRPFWSLFDKDNDEHDYFCQDMCIKDAERKGHCWCGKLNLKKG